jgi:hypothetical protein
MWCKTNHVLVLASLFSILKICLLGRYWTTKVQSTLRVMSDLVKTAHFIPSHFVRQLA